MKKILVLFLAVVGMLALAGNAFAINATSNATATIQTGIACAKDVINGDLAFGTIMPDMVGGTVVINPATFGRADGVGALVLIASTFGPATFHVTGAPNTNYGITLPGAPIVITDGIDNMTVDNWTTDAVGQQVLDVTGAAKFNVGGELLVNANQPNGVYTGTFQVSVDYN